MMGIIQRVCICLLCLFALKVTAQPDSLWSRTYGGEDDQKCLSILQTTDGDYLLGGVFEYADTPHADFLLLKTNANGDSVWSRAYGGNDLDKCNSILQTSDGDYAMAGITWSYGAGFYDFWLLKADVNGDSVWSRTFGGETGSEYCESIQQTTDGGYVLAGASNSFGSGWADFWLVRTNANGDSLWSRTFGGTFDDWCYSVIQSSDGGFLLAGYTDSYGSGGRTFWLVKTDANGDSLWARSYGGEGTESCSAVLQTSDGGYLLAGSTTSSGAGARDFWLVKTNADGDSLWSRTYGGDDSEHCYAIRQSPDGGHLLAGYTQSFGAGQADFWLLKIDANGDSLWSRTFGGGADEYCYALEQTTDGGLAMAGATWSFGVDRADFWLVKLGPDSAVSLPPGPFERLTPADSSTLVWTVEQPTVDFNWTRSIDPNGDDVSYIFHIESPTFAGVEPSDAILTDTTISVEIALPVEPLDDIHNFYWTVRAAANGDTVEAANGEGYFTMDIPGAADAGIALPSAYSLSVYPNPFNPSTTISFDLPQQSFVSLTVYDLLGRELETLLHESIAAGSHSINWHCASCATGLYLLELQAGNHTSITKAILLR